MSIEIRELGPDALDRLARIPIRFRVASIFRVEAVDGGLGGFRLTEAPIDEPYVKDYDAAGEDRPFRWRRWDLSNWGFLLAFDGEQAVGAATVAFDTPGVNMLAGRGDLAVLWDLRVQPERRGEGIGMALFDRVLEWARQRGCTQLKIETQNINVRACRFYAARGCHLGAINRYAYAGEADAAKDDVRMLWYLDL